MRSLHALLPVVLVITACALWTPRADAHCQIPCGIYGDHIQVELMKENIATVEKAMKQIKALQAGDSINYHQLIRWVNNKELHATNLQQQVLDYWLAQRITPVEGDDAEGYLHHLEVLHRIIVHAMKAKQTTDLAHVETLKKLVAEFEELYFDADKEGHLHQHHAPESHPTPEKQG